MPSKKANKPKKKRNGVSFLFILYFFALVGFFVYMIVENGYIAIIPPFRFNDMSSEYWNWMIYQVNDSTQYYIDITYFIEVMSFVVGLIYMFANSKENGFKKYFTNRFNLFFDLFFLVVLIAIKVYLLTLPHYRLYMVLITPIFFNLFVIKFVSYSKKH